MSQFQEWLMQRMRGREWKQADLAREMDVLPGTVQRWFHGTTPKPEMITRLADLFAFDTKTLMVYAGYIEDDGDDPNARELVRLYEALPDDEKQLVLDYARFRRGQVKRAGG